MFVLPKLPYAFDALAPSMSRDTLETHYAKHHATYVEKTNALSAQARVHAETLESLVRAAHAKGETALFNNAAQAWNHGFFWQCMSPAPAHLPTGSLARAIAAEFGDFKGFRDKAIAEGEGHFGSGWLWLIGAGEGGVALITTHDADTPIAQGEVPLLTCDLWEHAYYLDRKNARKAYLEAFFDKLCDWRFADAQFAAFRGEGEAWRYPLQAQHAA